MPTEAELREEAERYRKVLRKDPKSRLFAPLAEVLRRLKLYDEGITVCKEGLKHHPDHFTARVTLGMLLLEKGMAKEALLEVEEVLKKFPDNIGALRVKASAYKMLSRFDEACDVLSKLISIEPSDTFSKAEIERIKVLKSESVEKGQLKKEDVKEKQPPSMEKISKDEISSAGVDEGLKREKEIQETKEFAKIFEKEGKYGEAFKLWLDVLKGNPLDIEAKRKVEELRVYITKDERWNVYEKTSLQKKRDVREEVSGKEIDKNIKALSDWLKKLKKGG